MVAKASLTKDEVWLEKSFSTVIAKLGAEVQDGGKKRDKFLDELKFFRALHLKMEEEFAALKLYKPDAATLAAIDPAKLIKSMVADRKDTDAAAKKGDLDKATKAAMSFLSNYTELTARRAMPGGGSPQIGTRMVGITVR